jgi:hypothetical protein
VTTNLEAVVHESYLAQQRRGCSLGLSQRATGHPHAPPKFPLPPAILLETAEFVACFFRRLNATAEVANVLPAPATEPQLHNQLA